MDQYNIVVRLTAPQVVDRDRLRMLGDFASEFGWRPSDRLDGMTVADLANGHLVVEHGLENTAVITFLREPRRYSALDYADRHRLLAFSYNNLVDWHIQVDAESVTFVFNRRDGRQGVVESQRFSRGNVDVLRVDAFERIADRRPNPNLPALDDALITLCANIGETTLLG